MFTKGDSEVTLADSPRWRSKVKEESLMAFTQGVGFLLCQGFGGQALACALG
jgi:hypothetical protein